MNFVTRRAREPTVVLVASHFPPSNLASVHRIRLLARWLPEFGWRPIVVAPHWRHYEEGLDWDLARLVDPALEVIRTPAFPTRPVRLVGDLGLRAAPWLAATAKRLRRSGRLDFLLVSAPSFYPTLIGDWLWREAPLPFGIDYQDPWINPWPGSERVGSKAWASLQLSRRLEPTAVRRASLVFGVAPGYIEGVLRRNPHLKDAAAVATAPIGVGERDFAAAAARRPYLLPLDKGRRRFVYAGALLPKSGPVFARLFEGLARVAARAPERAPQLHFVGTGGGVRALAQARGVADLVAEHPRRIPYLDALAHLAHADAGLIVGSTEPHYAPSKAWQVLQSGRPALALLHQASDGIAALEASGRAIVLRLDEARLPEAEAVAAALETVAAWPAVAPPPFACGVARDSARTLAEAMDEARARWARRMAAT